MKCECPLSNFTGVPYLFCSCVSFQTIKFLSLEPEINMSEDFDEVARQVTHPVCPTSCPLYDS